MHAPTWPIDKDYAAAWDWAQRVRLDAKSKGLELDMSEFQWDNETGYVLIDGMPADEWVEAMTLD